jgi:hypothetical protein
MVYYPALVLSAIFFAAIVVNLKNQDNAKAFGISLIAVPSILFMSFLSQKKMDILAYFLLLVPIAIVVAGYQMGVQNVELPTQQDNVIPTSVPNRIEPKEEVNTQCKKCSTTPCMCPYKPTYN